MTTKIEVTGTLEGWCQDSVYPYIIWGNVYGDAKGRFRNGARIHTSYVVTPVEEWAQGGVVRTRNSAYLLGAPYNQGHTLVPVENAKATFDGIEAAMKKVYG